MASAVLPGHEAKASAERSEPSAWLEFLLVGGFTLVLWPLAWLARRTLGLDDAELGFGFVTFYGAYLVNDPHFSVTYLLFYRNARERALGGAFAPGQRARYLAAGFVAPVVLGGWAGWAIAMGSAEALGRLLELMFLLVGWHYVKQGFGVLLVLSGRRGVRFGPNERRVLLAHALAGWAFAWASPAVPPREVEEKGVVYLALGHPQPLMLVTGFLFALSTLALLAMLVLKLGRERRLPPPAALVGFLVSIWAWSVLSSVDPLMVYAMPALHSLQYLYFVWLLRRNEAREAEAPPHFGRPTRDRLLLLAVSALALGWLQFHLGPSLLDGLRTGTRGRLAGELDPLGPTPWFAALFAVVNIHHYLMDTVIWRRENPETSHLYR